MSMKLFTGLQDFLGLYDPTVSPSTTNSSTSHIASLFGTAANNRHTQQQQHRKRSPSLLNKQELGDERISRCSHSRSVHFPENEDQLVSGYHEAPTNSFHLKQCHETSLIAESYSNACKLAKVAPNPSVEHQIACFHQIVGVRQECLSLKGQRLSQAHMECLEEIFRRVQFDTLDFEYTFIDDDAAVSLAEMLEFYDSTVKLNLSFNKQINIRGWQALFRAIKNCQSLQLLNLRYTSLSDRAIPVLARTLRTQPTLTTLHLENVSLSGKNLLLLVCALKTNTVLRELYLGENNLQPADGAHLYQMIVGNSSIEMLDLRNNQLQDGGLRHICDALRNKETLEKSALSALVLWNNRLTSGSMDALANALLENSKLETLNIGSNNLSVEGIMALKPALLANSSLQRLGLQATNLDCQCAIVLAECLADNKIMVRVDLRDNAQVGSAGLLALHLAMKMNTSITLLNLDNSCAKSSSAKVKEYHEQFKLYFDEIKSFCERNKQLALQKLSVQSSTSEVTSDSESSDSGQADDQDDKQEAAAETKDREDGTKVEGDDACEMRQVVPVVTRQKNFDSPSHRKKHIWKFTRSSSLTCTELVEDINERILQMSRSCSTLDSAVEEQPSLPSPQKALVALPAPSQPKGLAEVGKSPSLPSLALLASATDSTATIKKQNQRFAVSLSSHSASNPDLRRPVSPRFKVMPVTVSSSQTLVKSTSLSMASNEAVVEKGIASSSLSESIPSKTLEMNAASENSNNTYERSTSKFVDVSSEVMDNDGNSAALSKVEKKDGNVGPDLSAASAISKASSRAYPSSADMGSNSAPSPIPSLAASSDSLNIIETEKSKSEIICSSKVAETGRKPLDRHPHNDETVRAFEKSTQSCTKSAQFVEEVCDGEPCSRMLIEGHCEGGYSTGATSNFCSQSSDNRCSSSSLSENSKSSMCPDVINGDKWRVADVANLSDSCDGDLSRVVLPTTADVGTISAPKYSTLDNVEVLVKNLSGTTKKSSLHAECSVAYREPLLESGQPIATIDMQVSTSKSESSGRDHPNDCDTDDFVFVVSSREVTPEKLPAGCNIEVIPQEDRSQFTSSANDEDPSGKIEAVMCTDDVEFSEKCAGEYMTERSGGMNRDESAAIKTLEVDSWQKTVICDDERTSDTTTCADITQKFLDNDCLGKVACGNKKLDVVSDSPPEVRQAQCVVLVARTTNANSRNGEPDVFVNVENDEDPQGVLCRYPSTTHPMRDALCLNVKASDEEVVRKVVKDLVNFTAFEMGDEDGFQYSGLRSPPPSHLTSPMKRRVDSFSPPRNPSAEASDCRNGESDEEVVHSIMRALVRDVLLKEKEVLSISLRKKRERLNRELHSHKLP
uniref:Protein phosphatase 1 regulatory subunit 37 n=1 Tax=Parascaris univalens TaxID=6257 RepID=A0A915C3P4_PARUN